MSEEEKFQTLSDALKNHDEHFDAKFWGIDQYENDKVPYSRRFTWEALAKYVASSPVGSRQQHHWRLQSYQCGLCTVDYNLITQLDHAATETKWILEYLNLTGKQVTNIRHQHRCSQTILILPKIYFLLRNNSFRSTLYTSKTKI